MRDMFNCDVPISWHGSGFSGNSEEILTSPQAYGVIMKAELRKKVEVSGVLSGDGKLLNNVTVKYSFPFVDRSEPDRYFGEIQCKVELSNIPLKERKLSGRSPLRIPHYYLPENYAFENHMTSFSIQGSETRYLGNEKRETFFSSSKPLFDSTKIICGYF